MQEYDIKLDLFAVVPILELFKMYLCKYLQRNGGV